MKQKLLEHLDIVARPDLSASTGCVLFVVICRGIERHLVPVNRIDKKKVNDFSYINGSEYPSAHFYRDGIAHNQACSVVGRLIEDSPGTIQNYLKVELFEGPQ